MRLILTQRRKPGRRRNKRKEMRGQSRALFRSLPQIQSEKPLLSPIQRQNLSQKGSSGRNQDEKRSLRQNQKMKLKQNRGQNQNLIRNQNRN
jgi:hypothetical protein